MKESNFQMHDISTLSAYYAEHLELCKLVQMANDIVSEILLFQLATDIPMLVIALYTVCTLYNTIALLDLCATLCVALTLIAQIFLSTLFPSVLHDEVKNLF
jgi:hypothetical protein